MAPATFGMPGRPQPGRSRGGTGILRPVRPRPAQVGLDEDGLDQVGPAQVGAAEVGADQVGALEIGIAEVGPAQVGPGQMGRAELDPGQLGLVAGWPRAGWRPRARPGSSGPSGGPPGRGARPQVDAVRRARVQVRAGEVGPAQVDLDSAAARRRIRRRLAAASTTPASSASSKSRSPAAIRSMQLIRVACCDPALIRRPGPSDPGRLERGVGRPEEALLGQAPRRLEAVRRIASTGPRPRRAATCASTAESGCRPRQSVSRWKTIGLTSPSNRRPSSRTQSALIDATSPESDGPQPLRQPQLGPAERTGGPRAGRRHRRRSIQVMRGESGQEPRAVAMVGVAIGVDPHPVASPRAPPQVDHPEIDRLDPLPVVVGHPAVESLGVESGVGVRSDWTIQFRA